MIHAQTFPSPFPDATKQEIISTGISMKIHQERKDQELTVTLNGRLDTTTAPLLEQELQQSWNGISTLILDLKELDYISSAGLRVILAAQKQMLKQGSMILRNLSDNVREVFEMTGFADIMTIE